MGIYFEKKSAPNIYVITKALVSTLTVDVILIIGFVNIAKAT